MRVDDVEIASLQESAYRVVNQRIQVDAGGVSGRGKAKCAAYMMREGVLGQDAAARRTDQRGLMPHLVELVGEVEHVAGNATGKGNVVRGYEEDTHWSGRKRAVPRRKPHL